MTIALVTGDAPLRDLAPAWQRLWSRTPAAAPFQSPAWMLSWWSYFGTGQPVVAVASAGERLQGLLGCYLLGSKLLPIGAGITDYQDMLLADDAAPGTAAALLAAVLTEARRRGAENFDLTDLPPEAALRSATMPSGWRDSITESDCCPVLVVLPHYTAALPSGRLRDIRQARHRAARAGGYEIELVGTGRLEEALDALEHLHTSRWRSLGESGVLADPLVQAFHRRAAPLLQEAGALRLSILRIAGVVAACCYALLAPGRMFLYLSGFDPRFAFESPGTILLGHVIADAIAEGRREIHFLRGDERYKFAWGGSARMNVTRSVFPP